MDLIDLITVPLAELLEEYNIRYTMANTRRYPGIMKKNRPGIIEPFSLVLEIGLDWHDRPRQYNVSQVFCGKDGSSRFAEILSDALSEWGTCAVFGHRSGNARIVDDPLLNSPDCIGVRIEPYAINGPNAGEYIKKSRNLARDLAAVIAEFTVRRSEARSANPISVY